MLKQFCPRKGLLVGCKSRCFSSSSWAFSGHNKWSTIKHDKAKNDAQKNKIAAKFAVQIAVATRLGGPDIGHNFQLSNLVENANRANVPKKVIEAAIKRGSGQDQGSKGAFAEMATYEGVGPGGVAFVVEALTDNKSRTIGQVKAAFAKAAGMISPTAYLFDRRGWVEVESTGSEDFMETLLESSIDAGAEDVEQDPDDEKLVMVYTKPQDTAKIAKVLKEEKFVVKDFGIEYAPQNLSMIEELEPVKREQFDKLVNTLNDLDDVTDIYTNLKN